MDPASVSRCPEWSNPVRSVAHGILGMALVQSIMAGIGFIGVFIGSTQLVVSDTGSCGNGYPMTL